MTASQWQDWLNFDAIRPIGNEQYRHELRHGQWLAHYTNLKIDTKKHTPYKPIDFMNFVERREEEPKTLDLSKEDVQAQIDKDVFGL